MDLETRVKFLYPQFTIYSRLMVNSVRGKVKGVGLGEGRGGRRDTDREVKKEQQEGRRRVEMHLRNPWIFYFKIPVYLIQSSSLKLTGLL